MKNLLTYLFTRIKDSIIAFFMPVPKTNKNSRVLNIVWLVLAAICFIGGLVVALFFPYFDSPLFIIRFWYSWGLICAIPFTPQIISPIIKAIKVSKKIGKTFTYDEYTTSRPTVGSDIVIVTKEKRNLGAVFGFIVGFFAIFIQLLFATWLGTFILVIKSVLTVKELAPSDKPAPAKEATTVKETK